jgi:hypothetical protein
MRYASSSLLVVFALVSGGCVALDLNLTGQKAPPPATAPTVVAPVKPVTAEQISEANAHEKAKALLEELNRDGRAKERQP